MDATALALAPGTHVGEYVIERHLRALPQAVVYRATQPSIGRAVALTIAGAKSGTPAGENFLAQARALAGLDHPHVLPVFDAGTDGPYVFAATPLTAGRRASEVIAGGSLPAAAAVGVVEQLAQALEALERAGVPSDPHASSVVLERGPNPIALLDPLAASTRGTPPARRLAELLEALVGSDTTPVVTAAHRASAASASPSAVAAAARAALPRPRQRRRFAMAIAGTAAIAAAFVVVLRSTGGDDATPAASPFPARIVATIPLGAEPAALAVAGDTLWVSTFDGGLTRVDMRTNRVVGVPVRPSPKAHEPMNLVSQGGALYGFDSEGGAVLRLDSATAEVLARRRLGGRITLTGALAHGSLWVAVEPSERNGTGTSEIVPLDARTLEPAGSPLPVGRQPSEIAVDGDALFVVGNGDGTLTRIDVRTRATRQVLIGVQPGAPALIANRLWVPDAIAGVVSAIDVRLERPPSIVTPVGETSRVVLSHGAPWAVVADQHSGSGAPAQLVRLDARTGLVAGRPLDLGRGANNLVAGDDDLWIASRSRRSLLRVAPLDHVPAAQAPRETDATNLRSGPSRAGRRAAEVGRTRVSLDPGGAGWSVGVVSEGIDLRRFDDPGTGLMITIPDTVYGRSGSTRPARDTAGILRTLRRVPDLRVGRVRRVTVAGRPARSLMVSVAPTGPSADFCGGPCLPIFGRARLTLFVAHPAKARLTMLDLPKQTLVFFEDTPDGRSLSQTGAIVKSVRIG